MREEAHAEGAKGTLCTRARVGARDAEPDAGRSDEESDEGADELGITPKRFATSPCYSPHGDGDAQSRWIGSAGGSTWCQVSAPAPGVAFDKEVLGADAQKEGRLRRRGTCTREGRAPDWKVTPEGWWGRHALRDCSDSPQYLPFICLGSF